MRAEDAELIVANREIAGWLNLFYDCFNQTSSGWRQWSWPYAGGSLNQPQLVLEVFAILRNEANLVFDKEMKAKNVKR